jgi:enolase
MVLETPLQGLHEGVEGVRMADKHVERLQRIIDQWRDDARQWGDDGEIAADIAALEAAIDALQPAQRRAAADQAASEQSDSDRRER